VGNPFSRFTGLRLSLAELQFDLGDGRDGGVSDQLVA
jgi:hypothetical protein